MSTFTPNRHFRRDYDRIYRKDPAAANLLLLMAELANERGTVELGEFPEVELQKLMAARFYDPRAYQLPGGPKQ
jgi:hypothetical protein